MFKGTHRALSPAVARIQREFGLDMKDIFPTGPKGLILKGDALAYIKSNNLKPNPK